MSLNGGLLDGELFVRWNVVVMQEQAHSVKGSLLDVMDNMDADLQPQGMCAPLYIFFCSITDMEDWHLALLAPSLSAMVLLDTFTPFPHHTIPLTPRI